MSGSWIILGATSTIARAFAREVARQRGVTLLLAGRAVTEIEADAADLRLRTHAADVQVIPFDARDTASFQALAQRAQTLPRPVSVFLAFGAMPPQEEMIADAKLCASMITATYTGAVQVLNALTPLLEAQKAGSVVVLGSVAGDRGRKKNYLYGSAKAGLHAFTQGLAARLSGSGVSVLLVKPGVIDTAMTWGLKNPPLPLGQPDGLARACLRRARKGGVLYYPWFWRWVMLIILHLPRRIFNRLNF